MRPDLTGLHPLAAVAGGRVVLEGQGLQASSSGLPTIHVGDLSVAAEFAAPTRLAFRVPEGVEGLVAVRVEGLAGASVFLETGRLAATGLHQVDSPAVARDGTAYFTYSGARGQQSPVSIYRVPRGGTREIFATGITNATSLAFDPEGRLHASSRFDGKVWCVDEDGEVELVWSDLGITCGMAFARDGTCYVGDRAGTVFRIAPDGLPEAWVGLPASVAAYHLALAPAGDALFVSAPTLATREPIYRLDIATGAVTTLAVGFGRPQGLACDAEGRLFAVDALAGASGLSRIEAGDASPTLVASGEGLVGVAFDPAGDAILAASDRAWRLPAATLGASLKDEA